MLSHHISIPTRRCHIELITPITVEYEALTKNPGLARQRRGLMRYAAKQKAAFRFGTGDFQFIHSPFSRVSGRAWLQHAALEKSALRPFGLVIGNASPIIDTYEDGWLTNRPFDTANEIRVGGF